MEEIAAALEASRLAALLRGSRWTYPAVNTAHILGVATLFGALVPMDLRLMRLFRANIPVATVTSLLRPVAALGAAAAVLTGSLLFIVQATDYITQPLLAAKLALVAAGLIHALAWGNALDTASPARQRAAGALSLAIWATVIVCGRVLGYL